MRALRGRVGSGAQRRPDGCALCTADSASHMLMRRVVCAPCRRVRLYFCSNTPYLPFPHFARAETGPRSPHPAPARWPWRGARPIRVGRRIPVTRVARPAVLRARPALHPHTSDIVLLRILDNRPSSFHHGFHALAQRTAHALTRLCAPCPGWSPFMCPTASLGSARRVCTSLTWSPRASSFIHRPVERLLVPRA